MQALTRRLLTTPRNGGAQSEDSPGGRTMSHESITSNQTVQPQPGDLTASSTFERSDTKAKAAAAQFPLGASALVVIALAAFVALKTAVVNAGTGAGSPFWLDAVLLGVALALSQIRYSVMSAPPRILLRAICMMVLFQILFEAFGAVYNAPNLVFSDGPDLLFFRYGALIALIAGALSWFRPSFALVLLAHYVLFREHISSVAGIPIVRTDYMSMTDVALFVAASVPCVAFLTHEKLVARYPAGLRAALGDVAEVRTTAWLLIWAVAVGAHLGNYFWSGYAKLRAGEHDPLTWLFHNPTETAILIGLERGDNPLGALPQLLDLVWMGIRWATPVINPLVLGAQFLVFLAPFNRRVLTVFTVAFDCFHVIVYMTLGAIFQFWIFVNLLVVASLLKIPKERYNLALSVAMVAAIFGGKYLFYTSHLGWLDGPKLAAPNIYVDTRDGRRVHVPAVYFGIFSYTLNQTQSYIPPDSFPMRVGGNTKTLGDFHDASTCGPATIHSQDTGVTLDEVRALIQNTDTFMRRHPEIKRRNLYYIYPHHMMPNPAMFKEFNALTMDDIVGYRYAVDSVCLSLKNGKLIRDVRKHWETPIAVPK